MDKLPITKSGEQELAEKLRQLKTKDRPEISQAIAEARAHGDLKENAEYHAAREQQSFAEGRIKELEHKLSHAQIIDVTTIPVTGKVVFGATVTLVNVEDDRTVAYRIVGEDEADAKARASAARSWALAFRWCSSAALTCPLSSLSYSAAFFLLPMWSGT